MVAAPPHTKGNKELFEYLLHKRADPELKNIKGKTALEIANESNNESAKEAITELKQQLEPSKISCPIM